MAMRTRSFNFKQGLVNGQKEIVRGFSTRIVHVELSIPDGGAGPPEYYRVGRCRARRTVKESLCADTKGAFLCGLSMVASKCGWQAPPSIMYLAALASWDI